MTQESTTLNGNSIDHPRELLGYNELQSVVGEYGLDGSNPTERANKLRSLDAATIASFMSDMNRRVQGSEETLVSDSVVEIGEHETIAPQDRYTLFNNLVDKIKGSPEDTNPERIGDALALGTVLLHPFIDGNGRTSRLLGFIFREDYDEPDASESFDQLAEPRDKARERDGFLINGYIPNIDGDQSDPAVVDQFIDKVLTEPNTNLYTGPYGQAELKVPIRQ